MVHQPVGVKEQEVVFTLLSWGAVAGFAFAPSSCTKTLYHRYINPSRSLLRKLGDVGINGTNGAKSGIDRREWRTPIVGRNKLPQMGRGSKVSSLDVTGRGIPQLRLVIQPLAVDGKLQKPGFTTKVR